MGSQLIWPNNAIGVNVVLDKILALMRVRHTVSSKGVTNANNNVVISKTDR